MYDNAHFTKSKAIRNENAHLDCWKKFQGNAHLDCWKKIREMRNWIVAKNWQMRNYLLFYANLPGHFMRNCFVAYGISSMRIRSLLKTQLSDRFTVSCVDSSD